jgi:reverse gyrase
MENSNPNTSINVGNSTFGVISTGYNTKNERTSVVVAPESSLSSQEADDLEKVIADLKEKVEKSSELPDYKKKDALRNLTDIEQELAKTDNPKKQEGVQYFLQNLNKVVENVKPLSDLVASLISLLHLTL